MQESRHTAVRKVFHTQPWSPTRGRRRDFRRQGGALHAVHLCDGPGTGPQPSERAAGPTAPTDKRYSWTCPKFPRLRSTRSQAEIFDCVSDESPSILLKKFDCHDFSVTVRLPDGRVQPDIGGQTHTTAHISCAISHLTVILTVRAFHNGKGVLAISEFPRILTRQHSHAWAGPFCLLQKTRPSSPGRTHRPAPRAARRAVRLNEARSSVRWSWLGTLRLG